MVTTTTSKTKMSGGIGRATAQLRAQLREIGLNLSVWDEPNRLSGKFHACSPFCQALQEAGVACIGPAGGLAEKVFAKRQSMKATSPTGCCLIGMPVQQRRRIVGTVVACYPPMSIFHDENFFRLCDKLKIDREALASMAEGYCRHGLEQANDFLRIVGWMLAREQSAQIAQEELANLSANLASTYGELELLYAISGSMNLSRQPREFLQNVCSQILEVMNISAAAGVIYGQATAEEDVVIAGNIKLDSVQIRLLVDEYVNKKIITSQQAAVENDFANAYGGIAAVRNLIAVPLISDRKPIGVLIGFNKCSGDFDSIDLKLISSIGSQTAIFLEYSRLYADMEDLLMGVLHAMTASIDAKDPYTCGHSQRVALISRRLAEACDLPADRVQRIYLTGLLHDVGKIGVPESLLRKPGKLTPEEYEMVKNHPVIGAKILGGIRQLEDVLVGIITHHERLDGKGYPNGLKGEAVPLEGRILGLADCFDAMTSDRTYRKRLSLEETAEEIRRNVGTQLDTVLVEKLLSMDLKAFMDELAVWPRKPLEQEAIGSEHYAS